MLKALYDKSESTSEGVALKLIQILCGDPNIYLYFKKARVRNADTSLNFITERTGKFICCFFAEFEWFVPVPGSMFSPCSLQHPSMVQDYGQWNTYTA